MKGGKPMKIREGFLLREVAGNTVIVPVGSDSVDFNGIITINETGRFLWDLLSEGIEKEELLEKFLAEYKVDVEDAKEDIRAFIQTLLDNGVMDL